MSAQARFLRTLAARGIARCLTGRRQDLARLLLLSRVPIANPGLAAFLSRLARDLRAETGLAALLLHVGRHASPRARRRLVENLFFNWVVSGGAVRTRLRATGFWPPFFVVISPTMRCNLTCRGCYSGLYASDGELTREEIDRLLNECEQMGAYFVVFSGGEPYLLRDTLLPLFRKHRQCFFLTFTNGTLIDDAVADELGRLGNVAPAISLEGDAPETDRRRGRGVHEVATAAMARLRSKGVVFGVSITYTRENVDLVTSDGFVRSCTDQGAVFGWYFMFMPVGRDPSLDLVPTPAQRIACGQRVAAMRARHPMFLADFWNDGPAVGGCMAGGRRYVHVLSSGRVEPCVYAHFGVDTIREKTLLEAANSPFFRAVRAAFPYNDTANLRRPCLIIDNPSVLRRLVHEHVPDPGHAGAGDLLRDPELVRWFDRYADEMRERTEAGWLETTLDPSSRWFREKDEYRRLFHFGRG